MDSSPTTFNRSGLFAIKLVVTALKAEQIIGASERARELRVGTREIAANTRRGKGQRIAPTWYLVQELRMSHHFLQEWDVRADTADAKFAYSRTWVYERDDSQA